MTDDHAHLAAERFRAPTILLSGSVDYDMYQSFRDQLAAAPGEGDTATDMPMPMPMGIDTTRGLSLSVGGSEWGGKFGGPTSSTVDVIFGNVRYRQGDLRFNATLPWMRIRSNGSIYTGIDGSPLIVARTTTPNRRTRSGLADVTVGANWLALGEDRFGADVELSGRIKLPTASDSSGLSTGKVDYSVAAEVSRAIGVVTPSIRLGYRFLTDFDGVDLKNGFASSIGASIILFTNSVALISYDYTERASRFIRDAHEVSLGLSTPLGDRLRLNSYGSVGLSSGAADVSAGLSLTIGLGA